MNGLQDVVSLQPFLCYIKEAVVMMAVVSL